MPVSARPPSMQCPAPPCTLPTALWHNPSQPMTHNHDHNDHQPARVQGLRTARSMAGGLLLAAAASAPAQVLFDDQFDGTTLGPAWQVAQWQLGQSRLGLTPQVAGGVARLALQTYDPLHPGQGFLGTEIYTNTNFARGNGLELHTRLRYAGLPDGLVAAAFTYTTTGNTPALTDEIDIELLTRQTNAAAAAGSATPVLLSNWNDWSEAADGYTNGAHHSATELRVGALDLTQFNDFSTYWLPGRTEWRVNGLLVHRDNQAVPDAAAPLHLNLWVPLATWDSAYSAALQPAASAALNQTYILEIDAVHISAVPEPGTAALCLTGCMTVGLALARRGRRRLGS